MSFTVRLPIDEDVSMTPSKEERDVLEYGNTSHGMQFTVCADLPSGSALLIADDALVYASLFGANSEDSQMRNLFVRPGNAAGEYADSLPEVLDSIAETKGLRNSYEWFLVLRLLQCCIPDKTVLAGTAVDALKTAMLQFPTPGKETYVQSVHAKRMKLLETDGKWLGALLRLYPMVPMKQLLDVYELVLAHISRMYSPVSNILYGVSLSPLLAKIPHSCDPTGRILWVKDGVARVIATRDLQKGEYLTINRHLHCFNSIRCLQSAPAWIQRMALCSSGKSCDCSECLSVVKELQLKYGLDKTPGDVSVIVKHTEQLWSVSTDHDLTDIPQYLQPILQQPFLVRRYDVLKFIQQCAVYIEKLYTDDDFMKKQSPHVVCDVTNMVLQAAALNPIDTERLLGTKLLTTVVEHENLLGLKTVEHLLCSQGAANELVSKRILAHAEYCSMGSVYALHLPELMRMVSECTKGYSDGITILSIIEQLKSRPEVKEMQNALASMTLWCTIRVCGKEVDDDEKQQVAYCTAIRGIQSESFLSQPMAILSAM